MIKKELLEILCCPATHAPLEMANADFIADINHKIASGHLKNRAGEIVKDPIDGGLLRADGKILYLIRNDIPNMLIDQAVLLAEAGP